MSIEHTIKITTDELHSLEAAVDNELQHALGEHYKKLQSIKRTIGSAWQDFTTRKNEETS